MSLINVSSLTFAHDGSYDNIFENASFMLDTDWRLGFIGRNGHGKTTFLNLLMGKHKYSGTISASVKFDYFPVQADDKSVCTIDLMYNQQPDLELWQLQKELSLLGVDEDVLYRPFGTLSNGEQTKVLLAALFIKENNFLLIDEPTNHLDAQAREAVSTYLSTKKGFILVSHDRAFLDRCIDHVLVINKTGITVQKGNFSSWQRGKDRQDDFERAENERLQKDIKKLTNAARRTAAWSDNVEKTKHSGGKIDRGYIGHKAAKMMKRSKSIDARRSEAVAEKSGLLKNIETADSLALRPLKHHQDPLVEVIDLSVFYGNKTVCENISFTVNRNERVALNGKNGCGKSSILKLICGENIPHSGTVRFGSELIVSYVSQDTSFLRGDLKEFCTHNKIDETLLKTILRKLDFSRTQFEKNLEDFSQGQKKKVLLAQSLCNEAHLYIWDEPLNFIDMFSRIQIERLIAEFRPTMIFVEHDRSFADAAATKFIEL